ncbi:EAL domain-containing protein [Brenneria izadpanahii]|uniref:cyclic-guanylate-specific phosphodiesterase n=1 Tax=Brenneria izadpanahii TaxID=2722756 RepID=A0ABX7UUE5_9GAMM|nr:EAL domain-containing protein [Brenneria izadpanahii]QTF09219.1 EAL domain-containing protein [Brenneria izadpanahii]
MIRESETMRSVSRIAKGVIAFNIAIGVLCLLVIGQVVIARTDQDKLNNYGDALMRRANDVAMQSEQAMRDAGYISPPPCSDDDLFQLRFLVYKYRYALDIARLRDGKLICSAERGVISPPVALPKPDIVENNTRLWRAVKGLFDPRIEMDISNQGDVAVFTSPYAFLDFSLPAPGYSALMTTKDESHIYQSFGAENGKYSRQKSAWYSQYRLGYQCSKLYNICIYVRLNSSGILSLPPYAVIMLALFGGALGGSLSLATVLLIERNRSLSKQVYSAVCGKQLHANYQPLVCLHNHRVVGAEVLARWTNNKGENIPPDVFIPIAERLGIIGQITRQVTHMALEELKDILVLNRDFYLSINLDISDVLEPGYQSYLDELVDRFGIAREQIMLEITERSTANHGVMSERLKVLHDAGYKIALDDFGTGYSNLSYLAVMPFDFIKIDRMFTEAIGTDSVNAKMVEYLFNMMAMFNAKVVVEGIETYEQAVYAGEHCLNSVGQGWFFGKPMNGVYFKQYYRDKAGDNV